MDQAKKLGLPPSPTLATFGMTSEEKKRKRTQFLKEALITEDIRVDGMNRNWIPPPGVMRIEGLVIKEPEKVMKEPLSGGLKVLTVTAAFEKFCLAALTNFMPDFINTDLGTMFLLGQGWITLKGIWGEIDRIDPNPMKCPEDIKTYSNLRPEQKLFQYINSLDQKYEPVKREILRLEPLPSAKAAYAVVRKEAAYQNILGETSNDIHGIAGDLVATETEGLWLVTNGHRRFEGKGNGPSGKEDKTKLKYGNCDKTRHTKEQCFEIIGYPDWWNDGHKKDKKNLGPERGKAFAANTGTDRKNPIGFEGMTATIVNEEEDGSFPMSTEQALKSKHWKYAMEEEMKALTKNNTWKKRVLPPGKNIFGCRWVFTVKYKPDGTIERYKARLVAKANKGWPLHQFDVKNAFIHGELKDEVYMEASHRFTGSFGEREKYVLDLLAEIDMAGFKQIDTPMIGNQKLYIEKKPTWLTKENTNECNGESWTMGDSSIQQYRVSEEGLFKTVQSEALLLFKHNISSINYTDFIYEECQYWLGSDYHPIMMNWNTSRDCCNWDGVTCDLITGDVIGIDLSYGMLTGTIHHNTSLFNLPHLQNLNLAFNDFYGYEIPREIGRLTNLTALDLSYNNFSGEWELDTLLSSLTNLEFLGLSYNGFSVTTKNVNHYVNPAFRVLCLASCKLKVFPNSFRAMQKLERLDLSSNEIYGQIPHWAGEIGGNELYRLDLSHNFITGLPQFQWHGLEELYLRSNLIQGPFPPSICNISNLVFLDMSNNRIPKNISSSLQILNVKSNKIEGSFPPSICNMSLLTSLDISDNRVGGMCRKYELTFHDRFGGQQFSCSGESWTMGENPIQQYRVSEEGLFKTVQREALLLFKHNLSSINYTDFIYEECQYWLGSDYHPIMMNRNTSRDCCNWDGVTCDLITGDVIDVDHSCGMLIGTIHHNTSLFNLPQLQNLNLAFNDFYGSEIPREIGRFSNSLTHLNLSHCSLSGQVPPDITLLHKLVYLDLSSNYDLKLRPDFFINLIHNFTNLEELLLEFVNISSVLPHRLNISSFLKFLYLPETGLKGKLPHCWIELSNL
nr:leucine-rich repeat-containing protein [Tanacetum cinerariifolium]